MMHENLDKLVSQFLYDQASMTPDQAEQLSSWISRSPDNARHFVRSAIFHRCIHDYFVCSDNVRDAMLHFSADTLQFNKEASDVFNPEIWRLLSETENTAPAVECSPPTASRQPAGIQKIKVEKVPRKISRLSLATLVVSLAALLFAVVYVQVVPVAVHEEVATVADTLNAQWADSDESLKSGDRLRTNTPPLLLRKGIVKLVFDNDTSVLVEAPAEFVLVAGDQMNLNYGRAYAIVPRQAIGFTITTPNSKIIDLGTEFGVQVDLGQITQLHVVKGKTTLVAGRESLKTTLEVNQGQAKKITSQSEVADIQCDSRLFVRDIQSKRNIIWRGGPLDIADMVGGGNGLGTGKPNTGIRWEDGCFVSASDYYVGQREQGSGLFISVPDSLFIEGIFVPNSENGPIALCADASLKWNLPQTRGQYCYNINNAGTISRGSGRIPFHRQILGGRPCGTPDNPAVSMHANAGLTLNLEKIRQYYNGMPIVSFTALCGFSETYFEYAAKVDPELIPQADFYVLVDGQERFVRKDMTPNDKPCSIYVALGPNDRYLTLATTAGSDQKVSYDWCLFACPRLNME
ncbi:MAG: NPCBM/NEW2 domain-containing protein [Phycisphaerae bacterium]|nr:NPCBM/NEW2 domain-containing protein [Phycisphaerae bacterium]